MAELLWNALLLALTWTFGRCSGAAECTLFEWTGSGAGLGSPAEVLSGRKHAQAGVRIDRVVVLEPSRQKPHHGLGVGKMARRA